MTTHRSYLAPVPRALAVLALLLLTLAAGPAFGDDSWKQCAEEGDDCYLQAGSWAVRFGNSTDEGNSWFYYTEYNDSASIVIDCSNEVFGDPLRGDDKICQYREVYDSPDNNDYLGCSTSGSTKQCGYQAAADAQWSQCAKEGDDCEVNTGGMVAVRYGSYEANEWSVRNWSSTGGKFECSNHAWQFDPAKGYDKVCEWAQLPDYAMRAVAYEWKLVAGPCDNCTSMSFTASVGVSLTEGDSTTVGFSESVSAQVSESVNVGIGISSTQVGATMGYQLSASLAANWSDTVSRTTQVSESLSFDWECDFSQMLPDHDVLIYQFVTSSYRVGAGTVDVGDIQDSAFVCIQTPNGQPTLTPACLPNFFEASDPTGQTCDPGGQLISG